CPRGAVVVVGLVVSDGAGVVVFVPPDFVVVVLGFGVLGATGISSRGWVRAIIAISRPPYVATEPSISPGRSRRVGRHLSPTARIVTCSGVESVMRCWM